MIDPGQGTDEQLADLLATGDDSAGEELRRRYARSVYDFCLRTSLDATLAADATETTLQRLRREAPQRPHELAVRAWLFGIALQEALADVRQLGRPGADRPATTPVSPLDERFSQSYDTDIDAEALAWAWQAARGQRPRDYALLDLSLRRRLTPGEIAEVADLSRTGIYTAMGRLRGAFSEAFGATALYYRGREHCPDLAALIGAADGAPSVALRHEIIQHAETCPACRDTEASLPPAADLLISLDDVPLPDEVDARLAGIFTGPLPAADAAATVASVAFPPVIEAADTDDQPDYLEDESAVEEDEEPEPIADEPETTAIDGAAASAATVMTTRLYREPRIPDTIVSPPLDDAVVDDEEPDAGHDDQGWYEETTAPDPGVAIVPAGTQAVAVAAAAAVEATERIRFEGTEAVGPPRPPRRGILARLGGGDGGSNHRIWLFGVLGAFTLLAAYVGLALGTSIQGGGKSSGAVPLLPTAAAGVKQIACGTQPIMIDQRTRATLTFDSAALPGYQITDIKLTPVSPTASLEYVAAQAQDNLSVLFDASPVGNSAGRTDEYRLTVNFAKGSSHTSADCTILVRGASLATATATASSTPLPPTATATRAPVIVPTTPPVIVPTTPLPPTSTVPVALPTDTPSPTYTPLQTWTATATRSPTPVLTPTPTLSPTPHP